MLDNRVGAEAQGQGAHTSPWPCSSAGAQVSSQWPGASVPVVCRPKGGIKGSDRSPWPAPSPPLALRADTRRLCAPAGLLAERLSERLAAAPRERFAPTVLSAPWGAAPGPMAGEEADRRLLRPRCPWSCPRCCMCGDSENPPGLEVEPTALGLSEDMNLQVGGPGASALGPGDGGGVQLHPLPGCAAWGKSLALPGPQLHLWQREEGGLLWIAASWWAPNSEILREAGLSAPGGTRAGRRFPQGQRATQFLDKKVLGEPGFFLPSPHFNPSRGAQTAPRSPS